MAINASLMTLGRCLEALRWNQQHRAAEPKLVPYRESKVHHAHAGFSDDLGLRCPSAAMLFLSSCSLPYTVLANILQAPNPLLCTP